MHQKMLFSLLDEGVGGQVCPETGNEYILYDLYKVLIGAWDSSWTLAHTEVNTKLLQNIITQIKTNFFTKSVNFANKER